MKAIIDTKIALDLMMARKPFADSAEKVFALCCSELADGYFSANSFCDIHYLLHKYLHSEEDTRTAIGFWLDLIGIAEVTEDDCRNALDIGISDYEDAVMASIAQRKGLDFIVTRNIKDFKNSPVRAIAPEEFVSLALKNNV